MISSCCVIKNTLGCTVGLSICTGRIGYVDVNAPPSLLTLAPAPLPVPLPKLEVLPRLPVMLWAPLPILVPNCTKLGQSILLNLEGKYNHFLWLQLIK